MKNLQVTALGFGMILAGLSFSQDIHKHYNVRYVTFFEPSSPVFARDSGTGTIEGRVIYVGKKQLKNKKKLITKDKEVCGRGYKIDLVYEISQDKGVKNAVVFVKGAGKPTVEKKKLIQEKCEFKPRVIAMEAGSILEIINNDPVKHEANGVQEFETIFQLSQPRQGMVNRVKLDKPGVVEVTCNIHGWMKAWVVVTESPYYAVSDSNGKFVIKDVPAGEYTLKMWHEGFGEKELKVKVREGKVTKVTFEVK